MSPFLPAERSTPQELEARRRALREEPLLLEILNGFPEIVLILDRNRQIVISNRLLLDFLRLPEELVLGKRPGEAFGCIHPGESEGGCGTTQFCRECGSAQALLSALKGDADQRECRMRVRRGGKEVALDLLVRAVPVAIRGDSFMMFTVQDISDRKRREVLQHTFFHDVLNEAGVVHLQIEAMLEGLFPVDSAGLARLKGASRVMIEDIRAQRDLTMAEEWTLAVDRKELAVLPFLQDLVRLYADSWKGHSRSIALECAEPPVPFRADAALLTRVIGNLLKNALEATQPEDTVLVRFEHTEGRNRFSVSNPAVMPESVRLQVFNRSFSTKGVGRGIGTYSVKFLTEAYLGGRVWFESREGAGTTFLVELP